jgi:hypothetical protein
VRRALLALGAVAALAGASPTPAAPRPQGEWLAGDLHVHTTYSHDSYGGPGDDNTGPDEAYTLGFTVGQDFGLAAARGLHFLAVTDHNDVRSQADAGFGSAGVIGLPGYESSLRGHAQMLGARRLYDPGDRSAEAVERMAGALRDDGGVFQVNHPASGSTAFPDDIDWDYGYAVRPDTIEVWNIGPWAWQPPLPSANSNDDALRWWETWLDRGERVGATGGSDSHWVSTSAAQGPGQPTTWVFAARRTPAAILAGLRRGRTTLSSQPPALGGARAFLEADTRPGGGWEAMVGDTVPPRTPLRVRVQDGTGARLRIITGGVRRAVQEVAVTSPRFTHELTAPPGARWAYAVVLDEDASQARRTACDGPFGGQSTLCRNALSVRALTSALYVRE